MFRKMRRFKQQISDEKCTHLCRKFTDDEEYLKKELDNAFARVNCYELVPEHMTGKLVNES